MDIIPLLLKEFVMEAALTKKMLSRIPNDQFEYKPHTKSTSMQNLAVHIAELPSWVAMGLNTTGIDFGQMNYKPTVVKNVDDILGLHQQSFEAGKKALENANEEDLLPTWTMRTGEKVHAVMTKYEVIRHAFSQTTHHRAQLGVYLRLLNIPIPGTYGPSADENPF